MIISLPWPSAKLAGHNNSHWGVKREIVKKHRQWARMVALEAKLTVPDEGDIAVRVRFVPPNNRMDRTNYPILLKPYLGFIPFGQVCYCHLRDRSALEPGR